MAPAGPGPLTVWPHAPAPAREQAISLTAYRGEAKLIDCAATTATLNVFHALPDNEFDEYLIRHVVTGGIHGIQVKCIDIGPSEPAGDLHIPMRTFHASRRATLVAFAWITGGGWHPEALMIPAPDLARLTTETDHHLRLRWSPGARRGGALEPYRVPITGVGRRLEALAAAPFAGRGPHAFYPK